MGILIYCAVWGFGIATAAHFIRRQGSTLKEAWRIPFYWSGQWHLWTLLITAVGSLLGGILYCTVGLLFGMDGTAEFFLRKGLFDGGFYALIWAPGISFIACVMKAHKKRAMKKANAVD